MAEAKTVSDSKARTAEVKPLMRPAVTQTPRKSAQTESPPNSADAAKDTVTPKPGTHDKASVSTDEATSPRPSIDAEKLAHNAALLLEQAGKVAAAYLRPRESGEKSFVPSGESNDMIKTLGRLAEDWLSDPTRALEAQRRLTTDLMSLWAHILQKTNGEDAPAIIAPDTRDNRFKDGDWSQNPYFDFLKQAYLITTRWADGLVTDSVALDEHTRHKAGFYVKQLSAALSPSNFVPTNPELLRTTLEENGENLVRGLKMMAEDIDAGHGDLKVRQSTTEGFTVGVNMATTPGKVIFRNELIELIQYAPTTDKVLSVPLLIVPPWINKFYILDLNPEKSFIRWCVEQGLTVFVISWVNPDKRHAKADFETYMRDGIVKAIKTARSVTGAERVHTLGYCVGGTMLAVTLAWLAAKEKDRVESATFLTTQVDFTHAGDLKVFVDEDQISNVEESMKKKGYLAGSSMASAFNMLRPQDLIWPYVVNNYLKGKEPASFDLLYWNSDSTRMPEANHSFYLRNCYLDNKLSQGKMEVAGRKLDLSKVTVPIYNLAAKEDHIAPARSVFVGCQFFGGPVRYVLSGSGHIAGVVNPAAKPKYQFWTGGPATGAFEDWVSKAQETPGTWWHNWIAWIREHDPEMVQAREPGTKKHPAIGNAPGEYVRVKA